MPDEKVHFLGSLKVAVWAKNEFLRVLAAVS